MSNGDSGGGGFSFGDFFNALLSDLVAVVQAILDFLRALVRAIVEALNFLFAGQQANFAFSFAGDKILWAWLKKIWGAIYHGVLVKGLAHLYELFQKLQAWVKKLKAWLDRWHALTRTHQMQAFRRAINLIQRIRKVLVVFRLFHLKWATKLDNWLAGLEGKLIRREMEIARKTNEIIGWMNVILDPRGILRTVPLLQGAGAALRAILGALDATGMSALFPELKQTLGPGVAQRPWSDVVHQFRAESKDNSGDYGGFKRQSEQYREMFNAGFSTQ